MNRILLSVAATLIFSIGVFAQKGVDPQSKKIHEEGARGVLVTSNTGTSIDFGKEKGKERTLLSNPYKMNSRRDVLVENILDVLKEKKITIDESASRLTEGFIVTQPFIFAKGAVVTKTEINRYANLPALSADSYSRGRYTLTIEVQSIDGIQNNVSVTAKIDGKSENGFNSEWTTVPSSGVAENEFLTKLVEAVTGQTPGDVQNP